MTLTRRRPGTRAGPPSDHQREDRRNILHDAGSLVAAVAVAPEGMEFRRGQFMGPVSGPMLFPGGAFGMPPESRVGFFLF